MRFGYGLSLWVFLLVFGVARPGFAQDQPAVRDPGQPAVVDQADGPSVGELSDQLVDPQTPLAGRIKAAEALIEHARQDLDGAAEALADLLTDERPIDTRRAVLKAIAMSSNSLPGDVLADAVLAMRATVPGELQGVWVQALGRFELERIAEDLAEVAGDEQAELDARRLAIRALGAHRQRFAATLLIDLTSVNRLEQVQGWAFDALADLSHQPRMGRDRQAWAGWYNQARNMSASQWQRMLHENLLRLTRQRDEIDRQMRERLILTQRALYLATAEEQRPALLIEFLQDPLDPVRTLAMDLARQRAEDSGDFGPELRGQLRTRLQDPLARIREESATLLGQLLDADAAGVMAEILAIDLEAELTVQRAFLNALAQMPRAEALQPAYEMLDVPALQPAAAGMLSAAHRAGQGGAALWGDVRDRVREALEGVEAPRPQMVTLLGLVIAHDDAAGWSRIGGWLDAEDDRVREAAARVWAGSSRSLAVLAERSDDPVIRPIGLKAIAQRGSRNETLKAVAARRPDEPEDIRLWEQALVALAGRVPATALLDAIDSLADANGQTRQVREHMLTAAIKRVDRPDPPTRDDLRLLIVRAKTRVLEDAPALVVLDFEAAIEHADTLTDTQLEQARRGLVGAYLADGRVDAALKATAELLKPQGALIDKVDDDPLLDVLVDAALQAAEQGRKEDVGKVLAGVRELLGEALTAERDEQLDAVQAEIDREQPAQPQ